MQIKIDAFSGFLGAGKTKLIKKLINENLYTQKVVVIENEFGEIGIDGSFLEKYNIEVKEINDGCICCSIFNDFKKALQEIIDSKKIERIIIEPSGVGKLSEIIKVVKELEVENDVYLNMIITVVDATMYEDFIDFFSTFYKNQIIYASTIVLSRTQDVDYEQLQRVVSKIRKFNEKANIITTPWDNLSGDSIVGVAEKDGKENLFKEVNKIEMPSAKAKFRITRKNFADDIFNSWGIETPKLFSHGTLKFILNNLKNEELYEKVLRAKGIVQIDENTGFENFGIPFCMTVEAEVLGSEINYGTLSCEPKVQKETFSSVSNVIFKELGAMQKNHRVNSIIQASYELSKKYPDVPVIGSLTGTVTTSASIVDPISFLKELRKDANGAHKVIDYVSNHIIELAKLMIENGANVIYIADPTATGEILGPKMFDEYAVRYLNKVINAIHAMNTPVIVHICGKMNAVKKYIPEIKSDAISTDAFINLRMLKKEYPELTTMGNISTFLLEFGDEEKVASQADKLVKDGINIISPACGLSTSTPLKNIKSMTKVVKES